LCEAEFIRTSGSGKASATPERMNRIDPSKSKTHPELSSSGKEEEFKSTALSITTIDGSQRINMRSVCVAHYLCCTPQVLGNANRLQPILHKLRQRQAVWVHPSSVHGSRRWTAQEPSTPRRRSCRQTSNWPERSRATQTRARWISQCFHLRTLPRLPIFR
jgi:hypothetical protein